jgi:hypothetical protein
MNGGFIVIALNAHEKTRKVLVGRVCCFVVGLIQCSECFYNRCA